MAIRKILVHTDHNKNEIRNVLMENFAGDKASPANGEFYLNTVSGRARIHIGADTKSFAFLEDLNDFNTLVGAHDPTTGLPTTGSGTDDETAALDGSIEKGDYWYMSVAGTITGIVGPSENLENGDILIALVDGASVAADFLAIQANVDLSAALQYEELSGVVLASGVAFNFLTPAALLSLITSIVVIDSVGDDITSGVCINYTNNEILVDTAQSGVTVRLYGQP